MYTPPRRLSSLAVGLCCDLRGRPYMSQRDHHEDGHPHHDESAGDRRDLEPMRECLPGRVEQRCTETWQLLGRRHGTTEGVPRGLGCFAWNAVNDGTGVQRSTRTSNEVVCIRGGLP